jgi:hypothetical protein
LADGVDDTVVTTHHTPSSSAQQGFPTQTGSAWTTFETRPPADLVRERNEGGP